MSEAIKAIVGEELYNQIIAKGIKEDNIDLLDNYVSKEGHLPRQRYNEVSEKLKATEEKIKSYEQQLEETQKLIKESETFKAENEQFKTKLDELVQKYDNEIQGKDKEIENVLKKSLVKERLITEGAKHTNLLMKEIDFDGITVKEDKLFNFDDTFNEIKTNYADLFVVKQNEQNVDTGGNQNNQQQNNTSDDWSFMDNIKE